MIPFNIQKLTEQQIRISLIHVDGTDVMVLKFDGKMWNVFFFR